MAIDMGLVVVSTVEDVEVNYLDHSFNGGKKDLQATNFTNEQESSSHKVYPQQNVVE